jgi:hypothetical protein
MLKPKRLLYTKEMAGRYPSLNQNHWRQTQSSYYGPLVWASLGHAWRWDPEGFYEDVRPRLRSRDLPGSSPAPGQFGVTGRADGHRSVPKIKNENGT